VLHRLTCTPRRGEVRHAVSQLEFLAVIWPGVISHDEERAHVFPRGVHYDKDQHGRNLFDHCDADKVREGLGRVAWLQR